MDLKPLLESRGLWIVIFIAFVVATRSLADIVKSLILRNEPLERILSFILTVVLGSFVCVITLISLLVEHERSYYLIIVLILLFLASLAVHVIISRFKE